MLTSTSLHSRLATRPRAHGHRSCPLKALPMSIRSMQNMSKAAAASGFISTGAPAVKEVRFETDARGRERLTYTKEGWNFWSWNGHNIHWLEAGPKDADTTVVLIHGYGASAYHWRYQVPELAKTCRVYAVCLLGFGWSTKALVDYTNGKQWVAQLSDFLEQVVGGPAVLVGNSLGGYASLATAAARPDLVRGVALLNGAGPIQEMDQPVVDPDAPMSLYDQAVNRIVGLFKRVVLFFAFIQAKQPGRIKEVLEFVYVDKQQIDDDLVDSIVQPATDPSAAEVFFLLNHRTKPPRTINTLLSKMAANNMPLLLLWGMQDPWITPARAQAVIELYPAAKFAPVPDAGHCPHDDCPAVSNSLLGEWVSALPAAAPSSLSVVADRLRAAL